MELDRHAGSLPRTYGSVAATFSDHPLCLPSREELADQVARVRREIGGRGRAGVAAEARAVDDG